MTKNSVTSQRGDAANGRVIRNENTTQKTIGAPRSTYGGNEALAEMGDESPPILMLSTKEMQGGRWKGNNARRTKGVIERLPSLAHVDDNIKARTVHPRARTRYRTMLTADGNERSIVHSNGAGHLPVIEDGRWSRDGYAQFVVSKGYALGWIDVHAGCVKRQIADKLVNPDALLCHDEIAKLPVCAKEAKTCKHLELERGARQARHNEAMAKVEKDLGGGEERQLQKLAQAVALGLQQHAEKTK